MGVVLFAFAWYNSHQQKQYMAEKAIADSVLMAEAALHQPDSSINVTIKAVDEAAEAAVAAAGDSVMKANIGEALFVASKGDEQFCEMESDLLKLTVSSKGGRVASVELKEYKTYGGDPLMLFDAESSKFGMSFFIKNNYNSLQINTADYNFTALPTERVEGEGGGLLRQRMRLAIDSTAAIEYVYTLRDGDYMVDFDVRFIGMGPLLANQSDMEIVWDNTGIRSEKGYENENNNTDIVYKYPGEKTVEKLGMSKSSKEETVKTRVEWVSFKRQFFSSIFVSDAGFGDAMLGYETLPEGSGGTKAFHSKLSVPFTAQTEGYNFHFYYGPNKYSILKAYDRNFEKVIPLGGWVIGIINRGLVIPVFDWLGGSISNFGIIILLLTLMIKILILPLTYKSYLSTAKMRLLKPEIEEITARYPKQEDALKKQQATMELYKKAGANPMGGCLPMLIQLPILFAMFRFFPASIELRGESFLWADDLSSYDSILNLPFEIPFYGDHVSLFALLMGIVMFVSSKITYAQTAAAGPQMAGMKFMTLYMMPVMMVFWFNNYSSGLSYYYTLSTLITIAQTYGFRYAVDDRKLHQKMKENAKKPQKKSKFQERYQELLKQQQQQARQPQKRK